MKQSEWLEGLDRIDPALLERYEKKREKLLQRKTIPIPWRRIGALAACAALLLGTLFALFPRTDGGGKSFPIGNAAPPQTAPYFYGDEQSAEYPYTTQTELIEDGISVTARFKEALPDTYTLFDDWAQKEFRLLRFEILSVHRGSSSVKEFLFLVPVEYMTDFSLYHTFLFDRIAQYFYDYSLLYNKTRNTVDTVDTVIFGYREHAFRILGNNIEAFDADGRFDMGLWSSTAAWQSMTQGAVNYYGEKYFQNRTLEKAVADIPTEEYYGPLRVGTLAGITGEAEEMLLQIKNRENGLFVPETYGSTLFKKSLNFQARRYLGGFATNETVRFASDSVTRSQAQFTAEDLGKLPALREAVSAVESALEAGSITPPHLKGTEGKTPLSVGIFAWYAKTEEGIIGIVRISWCYNDEGEWNDPDHRFLRYYDDAYYVIEYGEREVSFWDRDALLLKLGGYETTYIYTRDYNEFGKLPTVWC